MAATTVLISGASGFIALHTIQALVKKGYKVVGSVRNEEKGEYVKKASGSPELFSYEIVEDISKEGAFDSFVQKHPEASVFLHTASPVKFVVEDIQRDLLDPAIKGTTSALSSIKAHGRNIKRVVLTSSYAAVFTPSLDYDPKVTFDEDSWNFITPDEALADSRTGYRASKAFAEKAAWDFVRYEKPEFALSVVNPVFVFGPQPTNDFDPSQLNTSAEIINKIIKTQDPNGSIDPLDGHAIDVRDVAKAHIVAFEKEEAKNERLLLSAGPFTQQTILDVLHEKFPKETKNVPIGEPGSAEGFLAKKAKLNNEKTRKILGFEFISVKQTIEDSARQILEVEGKP